jgi:O-antigen ligase
LSETQTFSTCLILGYFVGVVILIIEIVTPLFLTQFLHSLVLGKSFEINLHARNYSPDNFYKSGATVVVLLFWPCLAILWKRFGIFAALALTLFSTFLFYFSGSLSAWVALIVGIIAALGFLVFRRKAINCYIIIICLATLGAPLLPSFIPDATKLSKIAPNLPDSIFPRIVIWKYAASVIADDPILGKGLDTARVISRNSKKIYFFGQKGGARTTPGIPLHPHNAILQIWLELGLIGTLIFAAIMVTILQKVKRLNCDLPACTAVVGMFFTALFVANVSYGIWQSWWQSAIWLNAAFIIPLTIAHKSNGSKAFTQ